MPGHSRNPAVLSQGVFKRIHDLLLEEGIVRPGQVVCPATLPTPEMLNQVITSSLAGRS